VPGAAAMNDILSNALAKPFLSYSSMDSVKVKAFNFSFGLISGLILFAFGL
jgi:hypothetical protein